MTLSKRERLLALVVGTLAVVMLVTVVGGMIVTPIRTHYKEVETARQQIVQKDQSLLDARLAQKKMADWRPRALPSDAQSLYDNWLFNLGKETFPFEVKPVASSAGSAGAAGTAGAQRSQKSAFNKLRYTLTGQGKLGQLIDFLYKFYGAGYLHQIHSIDIKRAEKSSDPKVTVTMTVEILSPRELPGTSPREVELPKKSPPAKMPKATLAVYQKDIAERNPFAPFTPPAPPPAGEGGDIAGVWGAATMAGVLRGVVATARETAELGHMSPKRERKRGDAPADLGE